MQHIVFTFHIATRFISCNNIVFISYCHETNFPFDLRSISSATPVFALHLWVVCGHDDPRLCVLGCIRVARLCTSLLSVFRLAGRQTVGSYVSLWNKIFTKVPHGRESKVHLVVRPQGSWLSYFPTFCASYIAMMLLCRYEREKHNWKI